VKFSTSKATFFINPVNTVLYWTDFNSGLLATA